MFDSGARDRVRPEPPVEGGQPTGVTHCEGYQVRVGDFPVAWDMYGWDTWPGRCPD